MGFDSFKDQNPLKLYLQVNGRADNDLGAQAKQGFEAQEKSVLCVPLLYK